MAIIIENTNIKNAKYFDDVNINCEINHPDHGWIPFLCNPDDTGSDVDITDLYAKLKKVASPLSQEEKDAKKAIEVRSIRDQKLVNDVDPLATNPLRWDELSTEVQKKIKTYRNALLDVPQQVGFPNSVTFPTKDF